MQRKPSGSRDRSGGHRKSRSNGIQSGDRPPVATCCTDYANPAAVSYTTIINIDRMLKQQGALDCSSFQLITTFPQEFDSVVHSSYAIQHVITKTLLSRFKPQAFPVNRVKRFYSSALNTNKFYPVYLSTINSITKIGPVALLYFKITFLETQRKPYYLLTNLTI
jgi:hypothetical protein